jgi:hypothetical protein
MAGLPPAERPVLPGVVAADERPVSPGVVAAAECPALSRKVVTRSARSSSPVR